MEPSKIAETVVRMFSYLQIDGAVAVDVVHAKRPLELFVRSSSRRHVNGTQKFLRITTDMVVMHF